MSGDTFNVLNMSCKSPLHFDWTGDMRLFGKSDSFEVHKLLRHQLGIKRERVDVNIVPAVDD